MLKELENYILAEAKQSHNGSEAEKNASAERIEGYVNQKLEGKSNEELRALKAEIEAKKEALEKKQAKNEKTLGKFAKGVFKKAIKLKASIFLGSLGAGLIFGSTLAVGAIAFAAAPMIAIGVLAFTALALLWTVPLVTKIVAKNNEYKFDAIASYDKVIDNINERLGLKPAEQTKTEDLTQEKTQEAAQVQTATVVNNKVNDGDNIER